MKKFLFHFGYCTPAQRKANKEFGWDDESSGAFFVSAHSEFEALESGCLIADNYVRYLFEKENIHQSPKWSESEFAFWIETCPSAAFSDDVLRSFPEVFPGEEPIFERWG